MKIEFKSCPLSHLRTPGQLLREVGENVWLSGKSEKLLDAVPSIKTRKGVGERWFKHRLSIWQEPLLERNTNVYQIRYKLQYDQRLYTVGYDKHANGQIMK